MKNIINFLAELRKAGMPLKTVYDVGACVGDWSGVIKENILPFSEFILFEANPDYKQNLDQTGFRYFLDVLSNPEREYVEFYNGKNTGDSYYRETTKFYDNFSGIKLPCTTLDKLVKDNNLPIPNIIKLDTQGSELDILAGAESFINEVDIIIAELPIVQYNYGAPKIQEYLEYFKKKRFVPVRTTDFHIAEDTILHLDFIFMREQIKNRYLIPNNNFRPFE